jgi:hypothetical protein
MTASGTATAAATPEGGGYEGVGSNKHCAALEQVQRAKPKGIEVEFHVVWLPVPRGRSNSGPKTPEGKAHQSAKAHDALPSGQA